jgi:hypothetical protein
VATKGGHQEENNMETRITYVGHGKNNHWEIRVSDHGEDKGKLGPFDFATAYWLKTHFNSFTAKEVMDIQEHLTV